MRLSDLVADPATNRASESKIWLHVAKAAVIWGFVHITLKGGLTPDLLWAFSVPLFAHEAVSRIVSWKFASGGEATVK